jgi:hypothetical protein
MAHIYMHFDFGADEEKAQQARHKLDVWKQAFRLDKKVQYKLDRPEDAEADDEEQAGAEDDAKPNSKSKGPATKARQSDDSPGGNGAGNISLLVRLYFSSHEKLSEQRWIERIPSEEPFKSASPKILRQGEPGFAAAVKQFADLN